MTDPNKDPLDRLPLLLRPLVKALIDGPKTVCALDSILHSYCLYGPRGRGRPRGEIRRNEALRVLWKHLGPGCVSLTEIPCGQMRWYDPVVTLTQSGRAQVRFYLEAIDD